MNKGKDAQAMGETLGVSHGAPRGLVNALVPGCLGGAQETIVA